MAYPFFEHRFEASSNQYPNRQDYGTAARFLDLMADAELQHGHHASAEALAWRAEALRAEAAQ